ncbi:hypothetical protein D3C81_2139030 [compost metagenome]
MQILQVMLYSLIQENTKVVFISLQTILKETRRLLEKITMHTVIILMIMVKLSRSEIQSLLKEEMRLWQLKYRKQDSI